MEWISVKYEKPWDEHEWFLFWGTNCCKICGTVKRKDGKNKPCKGLVKVVLRDA